MKISPNFDLSEFCRSAMAARLGRTFSVPPEFIGNAQRLCLTVLEPLRAHTAGPIHVLSGYRPLWLNRAVGGSPISDHMTASAADIVVKGLPARDLATLVERLDLPVKQCILEFDEWVHVSVPAPLAIPRREFLTARRVDGATRYTPGI